MWPAVLVDVDSGKFGANRPPALRRALAGPDLGPFPTVVQILLFAFAIWVVVVMVVPRFRGSRARRGALVVAASLLVLALVGGALASIGRQTVLLADQKKQREVGPAGYMVLPERFVRAAQHAIGSDHTWGLIANRKGVPCGPPVLYQWLAFRLAPDPPACQVFYARHDPRKPLPPRRERAQFPDVMLFWKAPRVHRPDSNFTLRNKSIGVHADYVVVDRTDNYMIAKKV